MPELQILHLSGAENRDGRPRCMLYRMSRQFVLGFLKGGLTYRVTANPVPDDAQIHGLAYDVACDQYVALVESATFPETPPHLQYPYADDPLITAEPSRN